MRPISHLMAAFLSLIFMTTAQANEKVAFSYSKCAHCLPVSMTPKFAPTGFEIETLQFNTGSDSLTRAADKQCRRGAGHLYRFHHRRRQRSGCRGCFCYVNGGSKIILNNDLQVAPDDWNGLRDLIAKDQGRRKAVSGCRIARQCSGPSPEGRACQAGHQRRYRYAIRKHP